MGATTILERWDGIKPDNTFQNPGMNSFNHYAYGAIGEWLYKAVAGIDQKTAGYKEFSVDPTTGGGLTHSRGVLNTMYGKIESCGIWIRIRSLLPLRFRRIPKPPFYCLNLILKK